VQNNNLVYIEQNISVFHYHYFITSNTHNSRTQVRWDTVELGSNVETKISSIGDFDPGFALLHHVV